MLLLQTAFAPEFAAVMAAGSKVAGTAEPTITIANQTCIVLMTGMGPQAARTQLSALLDRIERPELVLSIGLAGGLNPQLTFGKSLLVDRVETTEPLNSPAVERPSQAVQHGALLSGIPSDRQRLSSNLFERMSVGSLVTLERPALTVEAKQRLARQTGVDMCDMETFAIADECRRRQLSWMAARVISDTASDAIPAWIVTLPRLIEQNRYRQLLSRIATHPQDLPCLIRLALRMQRLKPKLTQLTIDLVTHVLRA